MNKIVTVKFRGNDLYGFQVGGINFVALKPIVDGMGLDWSSQLKRVKCDPILLKGMVIMTIPFGAGGPQECVCLRLPLVSGWLFTIESRRIKDAEIRESVQAYQAECYDVLFRYFSGEREKLIQESHDHDSLALRKVAEARLIFGLRAAAQMWEAEGLTLVPAMKDTFRQYDLFETSFGSDMAASRRELERLGSVAKLG